MLICSLTSSYTRITILYNIFRKQKMERDLFVYFILARPPKGRRGLSTPVVKHHQRFTFCVLIVIPHHQYDDIITSSNDECQSSNYSVSSAQCTYIRTVIKQSSEITTFFWIIKQKTSVYYANYYMLNARVWELSQHIPPLQHNPAVNVMCKLSQQYPWYLPSYSLTGPFLLTHRCRLWRWYWVL